MMKSRITCFAVASAALLMGACSDPKPIEPITFLTKCESNKVTTGGYIWTYTDPGDEAVISPTSDLTTELAVTPGGITGNACYFTGTVPAGPVDGKTNACGEPLYPAAGFGFGFQDHNVPFNLTGKAGVRFYIKLGVEMTRPIKVAVAQTTTDRSDPAMNDEFVSTCKCEAEAQAAGEAKSCYANYFYELPALTFDWQLCYVYFADLGAPSWGKDQGWNPAEAIKMQWDMPQPTSAGNVFAFDVWLDNIEWVTDEDVVNVATTGVQTTSGCGPAPVQ